MPPELGRRELKPEDGMAAISEDGLLNEGVITDLGNLGGSLKRGSPSGGTVYSWPPAFACCQGAVQVRGDGELQPDNKSGKITMHEDQAMDM